MAHDPPTLYPRRDFLEAVGRTGLGLAAAQGLAGILGVSPAGAVAAPPRQTPLVAPGLDAPANDVVQREYPPLPLVRTITGNPYRPRQIYYKEGTLIEDAADGGDLRVLPIAGGYVIARYRLLWSGETVVIYHGNGFLSWYCSLGKCFVGPGYEVRRNTPIALMGKSGLAARSSFRAYNLTAGLRVPVYAHRLSGLEDLVVARRESVVVSPYALNAKGISVVGRAEQQRQKDKGLPYQVPKDLELDERFRRNLTDTAREVHGLLRWFPEIQRRLLAMKSHRFVRQWLERADVRADFTLDKIVKLMHDDVTGEHPSVDRVIAEECRHTLEESMAQNMLRATSSRANPRSPDDYAEPEDANMLPDGEMLARLDHSIVSHYLA